MEQFVKKNVIFIVGYSKCATTSLFQALEAHPDVANPREKFLRFFYPVNDPKHPIEPHISDGIQTFDNCFTDNPNQSTTAYLDSTENYIFENGSLELIAQNIKNPKIIVLARSPIKRSISKYYYDLCPTLFIKSPTLNIFLRKLLKKSELRKQYPHECESSDPRYSQSLKILLNHFPKENILFLEMEKWLKEFKTQQKIVSNFCKINSSFYDDFILKNSNKSVKPTFLINLNMLCYNAKALGERYPFLKFLHTFALKIRDIEKKYKNKVDQNGTIRKLPENTYRHYLEITKEEQLFLKKTFDLDVSWVEDLTAIRHSKAAD
jgi:hypothetical protein